MAITGISAISGEQIIAAGAVSAKEAGKASFTTGGNDIQSLYTTVSTNSASWTGGGASYTGDAQGALDEVYSKSANWDGSYDTLTASSAAWTSTNNTVSTRSGYWNKAYITVNDNSAAWGGQALPISAGPGVKMDVVDDVLVFSNDETVLWSGNMSWGQNGSLTDSVKNYERIRFYIEETNRHRKSVNEIVLTDLSNVNLREFSLNLSDATTSYFGNYFTVYQINEVGDSITSVSGRQWWYNPWTSTAINGSVDRGLILTKVVGINRTASN